MDWAKASLPATRRCTPVTTPTGALLHGLKFISAMLTVPLATGSPLPQVRGLLPYACHGHDLWSNVGFVSAH